MGSFKSCLRKASFIIILHLKCISITLPILICLVRNSWLLIWIALEVNTIGFCYLAINKKKDPFIKYLIIQTLASTSLLIIVLLIEDQALFSLLTLGLVVKIGAAPFHIWFMSVTKKISWNPNLILITWQKRGPLYLILLTKNNTLIAVILITALLGAVPQYASKTVISILALSSVFNIRWMLLRVYASSKTVLTFVIIYWVSLSLVVITLKKTIKHINKKLSPAKSSYKHLLLIASLAGMPPTVGFLAKWYLLKSLRMINIILMLLIVLTLTSINLFIYLRIIIFINIIKPSPKKNITDNNKTYTKQIILWNAPLLILWVI